MIPRTSPISRTPVKPLCIDLFCGLGGWTEGFLAEGWDVIGFDIERHVYGDKKYPAQLVLQDVLTLHGSQFRNADIIVCSPPCQKYSYLAMPWSRSTTNNSQAAKALRRKWETEGPDNRLFDACFRIQREACEAAGRFIPLVVENVKGAVPWVGRSVWNHGSFHLWGDVPALMPMRRARKNGGGSWFAVAHNTASGHSQNARDQALDGIKGLSGNPHGEAPIGTGNSSWFFGKRANPRDARKDNNGDWRLLDGTKIGGDWFSDPKSPSRRHSSRSMARKAASAQIAKIPFELSSHIARVYKPESRAA